MPLQTNVFNFHKIAQANLTCDGDFANQFFVDEYRYHLIPEILKDLPTVSLTYHLNKPIPGGYTQYRHKIFANLGFHCDISKNNVLLDIYGNNVAVPIAHHMLLHSSIRWLTANNNGLLLHAGSVAKNGKSVIFSGRGGAGKTTTTSLILSSGDGWQIHADDYIFLRQEKSLAYVTRSHLYKDLLSWVPEVGPRLTTWEKVRLEVLGQIRYHTQEGIKWPVRLSSDRLWPDVEICDHADAAAILLLDRQDVSTPKIVLETNLDKAADELIEMNFYEARHYIELLKKAGIFTDTWLSEWKDLERAALMTTLSKVPVYHFVMPFYSDKSQQSSELLHSLNELVK